MQSRISAIKQPRLAAKPRLFAVRSVFVLIARNGCRRRILVVRLKRQFDVCLFELTFVVVLYLNSVTDLVIVKRRPQ